jgi:hypothetical protein
MIYTLLFDPSMSILPMIMKQNSQSVGLFTAGNVRWAKRKDVVKYS